MIVTKQRIAAALASGTILLNTLASTAFAATSLEISGNGSSSDNAVNVNKTVSTTVVQNNTATVSNTVNSSASTGGNEANDNTGGDITIATGNARTQVDLDTRVNFNRAEVDSCDCEGDVDVEVSGNGSYSTNDANLNTSNDTSVFQDNVADITNTVDAKAKTGGNDANRNTGGDTTIITGHALTDVEIDNRANANIARVGSNGGSAGSISALISGNGSYSDNAVNLNQHRSVELVQNNDAYIDNYVYAKANTGKNDANDNTGGDVLVDTGNATTDVDVENLANFNSADVDCGCVTDVLAKVSGNGSESENDISANSTQDQSIFGDNRADLQNYVDARAKTGYNDVNRNTGEVGSDPSVITGHADSEHRVSNIANANLYGDESGTDVEFEFDLGSVWSFFHD